MSAETRHKYIPAYLSLVHLMLGSYNHWHIGQIYLQIFHTLQNLSQILSIVLTGKHTDTETYLLLLIVSVHTAIHKAHKLYQFLDHHIILMDYSNMKRSVDTDQWPYQYYRQHRYFDFLCLSLSYACTCRHTHCVDTLQDCCETTDWNVFVDTFSDITELVDRVTDYINFCKDSVLTKKIIRVYSNNKLVQVRWQFS